MYSDKVNARALVGAAFLLSEDRGKCFDPCSAVYINHDRNALRSRKWKAGWCST